MIDFHCHLDLYPDVSSVVNECERRGLFVLCVTTTPSAWRGTKELVGNASRIKIALGLHPQLAEKRQSELSLFDEFLSETHYVGEIGLDGSPEFRSQWPHQVKVFEHILNRCSKANGKILSIHSRRAISEVLDCLQAFPDAGIPVLHWFSGTLGDLDRAIGLGCWFSVGPAMLAGKHGTKITKKIPRERVLTETDGPFARVNGIHLMPWDVASSLISLSQLWSLPTSNVETVLSQNLLDLLSAYQTLQTRPRQS